MDEVERRLKVDVEYCVPLLLSHAEHKSVLSDTSIVDEHIDRTEVLLYLLNHSLSLGKVGGVSSVCFALYSYSLNFLASSFQSCSHVVVEHEVSECDVSSFLSEFHGNGLADTTSSTSDECCLTC